MRTDYDFKKVLLDTIENLQNAVNADNAKIEVIKDILGFMEKENLVVVREEPEEEKVEEEKEEQK